MRTSGTFFGFVAVTVSLLLAVPAVQAAGVTVSGIVKAPSGDPAKDTRVLLVEANQSLFVEDDGTFRFENIAPGRYHIQAISRRFGTQVREVDVDDDDVKLEIELGHMAHHETIVVTAGSTRGAAEIYQPVNVLDQNELTEVLQPTIGETLKNEAGMNATQYGAGSSRPVIRGQGGGRIRILEDGLGVGDASVTSPDHAVASDPLSTQRVEIVRGPATLLYGNTAVGGVVNLLDERIPDHVPQSPIGGTVELRAGSVADERAASAELRGGGGYVGWYLNAFTRETDDYEIPGSADVNDPDGAADTLPNSAVENSGATLGVSWVGKTGYVGVAGRLFDSLYGIPVELEEPTAMPLGGFAAQQQEPGGIRIDMRQWRYDLRGGFDTKFGPFNGIDFRVGVTDYEHQELEGSEIGTQFFNDSVDARLEVRHGSSGKLRGSAGLQIGRRELEAVGAEAFLPPSKTDALALFALEEIESGPMLYEIGLRLERQETRGEGEPDRDFNGASASFGLVWRSGESYSIGGSIARTERFPRAEELYADGPHVATFTFEIGDPNLQPETSLGLDLALRKRRGKLTGELNLFANRYDDYIFEFPPAVPPRDGLPVFQFVQADAEFVGFEVNLLIELWEAGGNHLGLELISDYVRARLRGSGPPGTWQSGDPLPYIPPLRLGGGLHFRGARWHASLDLWYYDEQTRVPEWDVPAEPALLGLYGLTPTDDYTMVNAHVGYRLPAKGTMHEFLLRVMNLNDTEARNSVSRLKDLVPLPGRDVGVTYRLIF